VRFYQLTISNPAGQVYQIQPNGLGWTVGPASNGPTFSSVFTPWQSSALAGQPTWIGSNTIIFPAVLRGDIDIADEVTFPSGTLLPYALTSPNAAYPNTPAASNVSFQGTFTIKEIHHYGSFKQPDARAWNTAFVAVYNPPPAPRST
jgi:hypothetical protein